jgi:hypothetical protein
MTTPTSTPIKVQANRCNAALSTGPRSSAGKSIVSGNALRHGVLSTKPVLPGLEREEDWDRHRDAVMLSLAPNGALEELLAERVALQMWRLGRVARYEAEAAAVSAERAEEDWSSEHDPRWKAGSLSPLQKAQASVDRAKARVDLLEGVKDLPGEQRLDRKLAGKLVQEAADAAGVNIFQELAGEGGPDVTLPDYPDKTELDDVPWTAARFLGAVEAIAAGARRERDDLLTELAADAKEKVAEEERGRDELSKSLDLFRRERVLPDGRVLEKIGRYEAAAERSLYKALHELQRLQAARQGQAVTPPAVLDVDVSVGGTEG